MFRFSTLLLLALTACFGRTLDTASTESGASSETDADGDGFTADEDCDDDDADRNPGATEDCANEVDDDCDDDVDFDDSDC